MFTFHKEERLCSKRLIDQLFANGSSFILYPFRVVWMTGTEPLPYPAQAAISVSRKRFKRAVDRNRIKRLFREAYRKNKEEKLYSFLRQNSATCAIMFIYVGNDIFTQPELEKKLISALKRLQKEYVQSA